MAAFKRLSSRLRERFWAWFVSGTISFRGRVDWENGFLSLSLHRQSTSVDNHCRRNPSYHNEESSFRKRQEFWSLN